MTPEEKFPPFNVRDELQGKNPIEIAQVQKSSVHGCHIAVYNLLRDFNLASVIRNAVIFGFPCVHIIGKRRFDRRGTVGAHHYIDVKNHLTSESFFDYCKKHGFAVIGVENNHDIPADQWSYLDQYAWWSYEKFVLLFGEEGKGIPAPDLHFCDHVVTIRQRGVMRSLNTATASGIVMHSYQQSQLI